MMKAKPKPCMIFIGSKALSSDRHNRLWGRGGTQVKGGSGLCSVITAQELGEWGWVHLCSVGWGCAQRKGCLLLCTEALPIHQAPLSAFSVHLPEVCPPKEAPFPNSQKKKLIGQSGPRNRGHFKFPVKFQGNTKRSADMAEVQVIVLTWTGRVSQGKPLTFTRHPVYFPNLLTNRESAYFLWSYC